MAEPPRPEEARIQKKLSNVLLKLTEAEKGQTSGASVLNLKKLDKIFKKAGEIEKEGGPSTSQAIVRLIRLELNSKGKGKRRKSRVSYQEKAEDSTTSSEESIPAIQKEIERKAGNRKNTKRNKPQEGNKKIPRPRVREAPWRTKDDLTRKHLKELKRKVEERKNRNEKAIHRRVSLLQVDTSQDYSTWGDVSPPSLRDGIMVSIENDIDFDSPAIKVETNSMAGQQTLSTAIRNRLGEKEQTGEQGEKDPEPTLKRELDREDEIRIVGEFRGRSPVRKKRRNVEYEEPSAHEEDAVAATPPVREGERVVRYLPEWRPVSDEDAERLNAGIFTIQDQERSVLDASPSAQTTQRVIPGSGLNLGVEAQSSSSSTPSPRNPDIYGLRRNLEIKSSFSLNKEPQPGPSSRITPPTEENLNLRNSPSYTPPLRNTDIWSEFRPSSAQPPVPSPGHFQSSAQSPQAPRHVTPVPSPGRFLFPAPSPQTIRHSTPVPSPRPFGIPYPMTSPRPWASPSGPPSAPPAPGPSIFSYPVIPRPVPRFPAVTQPVPRLPLHPQPVPPPGENLATVFLRNFHRELLEQEREIQQAGRLDQAPPPPEDATDMFLLPVHGDNLHTREGIFYSYKLRNSAEQLWLKQVQFSLFQSTNIRIVKEDKSTVWECLLCPDKEAEAKPQAILHTKTLHGNLLPINRRKKVIVQEIEKIREQNKEQPLSYPCFVGRCEANLTTPLEAYFHLRVDHASGATDYLCPLCLGPIGTDTVDRHWEVMHAHRTCGECEAPTPSMDAHLTHLYTKHYDTLMDMVPYKTAEKMYRKFKHGDGVNRGIEVLRCMMSTPVQGMLISEKPFSKDFRKKYLELEMSEDTFQVLLLDVIDPAHYPYIRIQGVIDVMQEVYDFIQDQCYERIETNRMHVLQKELYWQQTHLARPPLVPGPPSCKACKDNESGDMHMYCIPKTEPGSVSRWLIHYAKQEHMEPFSGTLIAAHSDTWKCVPDTLRARDKLMILNVSPKDENMTYPTGEKRHALVHYGPNGEGKPLTGPEFFLHVRKVLETVRGKIREPVFIEFFMSYDTDDISEMEHMVRSFLDNTLSLQRIYKRSMMILAPVPRVGKSHNMEDYIVSLHRVRIVTRILYLHAAAFGAVVIPCEGYLYSIPLDKEWLRWWVKGPRGRGIDMLRNQDGSVNSTYLMRAATLLERAVDSFKRNHHPINNWN